MIYFIGGASRTRKSTFAKRISEQRKIQFIELDQIRNKLLDRPDNPDRVSEWFYPYLESFVRNNIKTKSNYILEIDLFNPEQVIELRKNFPLRACFIGSSTIDGEFLRNMNSERGWHLGMTDTELDDLAVKIKNISEIFKQKCEENDFQYIDVEKHENDKLNEIQTALFED